jgi:hypothetical protein
MIINSTSGFQEILGLVLQKNTNKDIEVYLQNSLKGINELIDWTKYLQIAHDLPEVSSLFFKTNPDEKRKEKRFQSPEICRKYLLFELNIAGACLPASIDNFSHHGIQFRCSEQLENNSVIECSLSSTHGGWRKVLFKVRIKYCVKHLKEYKFGAKIEEISDEVSFDFFNGVYDLIMVSMQQDELSSKERGLNIL